MQQNTYIHLEIHIIFTESNLKDLNYAHINKLCRINDKTDPQFFFKASMVFFSLYAWNIL